MIKIQLYLFYFICFKSEELKRGNYLKYILSFQSNASLGHLHIGLDSGVQHFPEKEENTAKMQYLKYS